MIYKRVRYATIYAFFNVFIAPFGDVNFKSYLLAEILTDCIIPMEDLGKVVTHLVTGDWNANYTSKSIASINPRINMQTPTALKWYLYLVSFLPYWWRMNQNMRKWLVYGHKLQAWNALKYLILILGPVSYIIYAETHIKPFKKFYYVFKSIGTTYKMFWDFYFDWGLFRGTRKDNRLLRDDMKFHKGIYYLCMVINVCGLFFWAVVKFLYSATESDDEAIGSLEFYNNVAWITWLELLVAAGRRTIWVLIRFESEFFSNYENFRDVVTIPPIKAD